jgi:L-asparaginase
LSKEKEWIITMKKVLMISTGGTISCANSQQGLKPTLTVEEMLERLPLGDQTVEIQGVQLMNIDSSNVQPEYWIDMANQVEQSYHQYDGFIITHGTDTLSYTAAALSYLIQNSQKPIVLTGSQRPIESTNTDAIENINNSIKLACTGIGGIFVVFNQKAILGTQARKIRTKNNNAFISLNKPYVAVFKNGKMVWDRDIVEKLKGQKDASVFYNTLNTKVAAIKLFPGLDPDILIHLSKKYDAVVLEAYGSGCIPFNHNRNFSRAIEYISETNCIIVVCTQVLHEGTDMQLYETGRKALKTANIIEGELLSVECAVTKLMWALGISKDKAVVRELVTKTIAFDKA